jgi:hypothetical protein
VKDTLDELLETPLVVLLHESDPTELPEPASLTPDVKKFTVPLPETTRPVSWVKNVALVV